MKLQYLAIIFIIIIIPVILVTSFYIQSQIEMFNVQTKYNVKLIDATKEAIDAFEINTVEWNSAFSSVADSKRRDILASVNSFVVSLANGLGIGGTSRDFMLKNVPAIAFTLYDGYYLFGNTSVIAVQTDDKGVGLTYGTKYSEEEITAHGLNATIYPREIVEGATGGNSAKYIYTIENLDAYKPGDPIPVFESLGNPEREEEKHMLRSFTPYSARYVKGNTDITINYALDNYIKIYGKIDGDYYVRKTGYLVYFAQEITTLVATKTINQYGESITGQIGNISDITYDNVQIKPERLEEKVIYKEEAFVNNPSDYPTVPTGEYPGYPYTVRVHTYVYGEDGSKIYYDSTVPDDPFFRVDSSGIKRHLGKNSRAGDSGYIYKKVSIPICTTTSEWTYLEAYQALNGGEYATTGGGTDNRRNQWYIAESESGLKNTRLDTIINPSDIGLTGDVWEDYSAINYYVESYAFTKWVEDKLGAIQGRDKRNNEGAIDLQFETDANQIFVFSEYINNPEDKTGSFASHKSQVIRQTIELNLRQTIVNYAKANPDLFDFRMPMLTELEWEQIESNVSIITFLQGLPLGRKYYSSYAIATSTKNKEYVDPNEMFFIIKSGSGASDKYYHKIGCPKVGWKDYTEQRTVTSSNQIIAYKSVDFLKRREESMIGDNTIYTYYFLHANEYGSGNENSEMACYYCIVDPSNRIPLAAYKNPESIHEDPAEAYRLEGIYMKPYYEALARERYVQNPTTFLDWDV